MIDLLSGLLQIDREEGRALVRQLTAQLRDLIVSGKLPSGARLPSSRQLSTSLKISRNTVTFAVEQLVTEGYLSVSKGRPPVVATALEHSAGISTGLPPARRGGGARPVLSDWASGLSRAQWPPKHEEQPRPFQPGFADERQFPHDVWARCLRRAARRRDERRDRSHNRRGLQVALRDHLAAYRGVKADPAQIIVLPTAQAALTLIATITVNRGDAAWVESPGYGGAIAAFAAAGARIIGVPVDEQGLAPPAGMPAPQMIFATPSHQYPTGRLMTIGRRLEILRLAEAANAWIIEDDYDGEFQFDERPIPSLQGLDMSGRVFYVGTFSKSTFSDVRLGYVVVPAGLTAVFAMAQRHLGLLASTQVQDALSEFIADGLYSSHIRKMRRLYCARRDHLVDALRCHIGTAVSVEVPAGGMQLIARLGNDANDQLMVRSLGAAGVTARPLSPMFLDEPRSNGLFLGFAAWRESEIDKAIRILARVVSVENAG